MTQLINWEIKMWHMYPQKIRMRSTGRKLFVLPQTHGVRILWCFFRSNCILKSLVHAK